MKNTVLIFSLLLLSYQSVVAQNLEYDVDVTVSGGQKISGNYGVWFKRCADGNNEYNKSQSLLLLLKDSIRKTNPN